MCVHLLSSHLGISQAHSSFLSSSVKLLFYCSRVREFRMQHNLSSPRSGSIYIYKKRPACTVRASNECCLPAWVRSSLGSTCTTITFYKLSGSRLDPGRLRPEAVLRVLLHVVPETSYTNSFPRSAVFPTTP